MRPDFASSSTEMPPLFVYGTLRSDCCTNALRPMRAALRSIGFATIHGKLYDLGDYPGLVLGGDGGVVHGELLINDDARPEDTWRKLDNYEGCCADASDRGLYQRVRVTAMLDADGSRRDCWVYVYNRDLSDARLIADGCWREHSQRARPL